MDRNALQRKSQGIRAASLIQFSSKYVSVGLTLVITMVLARLLTPEAYGIMAVISVFLGLFSIISNVGIGAAVVQYQDLTDEDCSGLFSFTVLVGLGMAAAFCALSPVVAVAYGSDEYIPLMCIASLSVLFHASNMVPNGMLLRDKKFLAIGVRTISTSLLAGILCIFLALNGWGVYALVFNSVFSSMAVVVWNIFTSGIRIGNVHFVKPLKLVFRFSAFQFVAKVIQYFIRNLDNMLIGFFLGSTVLGFYDKAYKLAKYPIDIVPNTITPVLKSFFASAKEDKAKIYDMFFKVEKIFSITGVLATVLCFCCPEELILLFFGDQWEFSIQPFRALSPSIVFQMMCFTVFSVLEGFKRTDYLLAHTAITGMLMLSLLSIGLHIGDLSVIATMISLYFILSAIPFLYFVIRKTFGMSVWSFVRQFLPEFGCGVLTAVVLLAIDPLLPKSSIESLAVKLAVGCLLYLFAIWRLGQLKYLKMIFKRKKRDS